MAKVLHRRTRSLLDRTTVRDAMNGGVIACSLETPLLRQIKPNVREAAAMLGATPAQVFREVDFPIVTRAVLVGAVFAFIISLGEFGATTLIARPEWATMPLAIYRLLGQPGLANYGQAMALSALLMLVSAVAIALMERVRIGEGAEF